MTPHPRFDAVIVGARAAGAAAALLLARRGLRVLAVDRARYGSDTLSTHALMRTAVVQLHRWGLLDRVRQSGAPPVREVTFCYPDETVRVPLGPTGGVEALYAPRRTVLDRMLVDAAREAGAGVRFGVTVTDLCRGPFGRVTGIVARDELGRAFEAQADVVIGADGIRSIVARRVGAETLRRAANGGATVYAYFENVEASGYEWAYAPGVAAGVIPTNGSQACVFVGGSEPLFRERVFPDLDRGFRDVLERVSPELAGRVGAASRAASYRGFAGVRGYVRRSWGPGWALVGDAGYFRDPITTHGISDALRDAELLSRAVAGGISMAAYEEQRDAVSRDLFEVTDRIAGFDWTMEEIRAHLRDVSRAAKAELRLIEGLESAQAA
jgi:flavin-dependent dehydrogenase